ncbi:hypothetical protein BKM31_23300 [[Actinomadura] parvosata subsp. kistnae]|uniref:Uncharacterized protein n=1 Tax=[Actinomadura] parvosata subsp. kistnae TaxID=1909395 RepID=A0A1V0A1E8_9ACTN|nr:hypothetical protein BKM31_23300 [Nonomuraea sp. ATCC 55076]
MLMLAVAPGAPAPSPPFSAPKWAVTRVRPECQVSVPSVTEAGRGSAVLPDLTTSTGARSHASVSVTVQVTGSAAVEVTVISSSIAPGVTRRTRSMRTVGSAVGSPSQRARETKRERPGKGTACATGSGSRPSTSSPAWESTRASAWKSPCTPAGLIWPSVPLSAVVGARTVETRSCSSGCRGWSCTVRAP